MFGIRRGFHHCSQAEPQHLSFQETRPSRQLATTAHLLPAASTVLDPVEVDVTKGSQGDPRHAVVVVLVYVEVERGVTVCVAEGSAGPQGFLDPLVGQPVLQLWGTSHVIDDALPGRKWLKGERERKRTGC